MCERDAAAPGQTRVGEARWPDCAVQHSEALSLMRPETGTQAQFEKNIQPSHSEFTDQWEIH